MKILLLIIFSPLMILAQVGTTQYPTSIDTSTTLPQATDNKITYLTSSATNSATTFTVNSTTGYPSAGVLQMPSGELVSYTGVTSTTFTGLTRGTPAVAYSVNTIVKLALSSAYINGPRGAVLALEAKMGIGSSDASSASTGQVLTKQSGGSTIWASLPSAIITSVFGRTGAVTAQTNDYTWAQIDKTTSSLADLTTRSAGDLSSGTLSNSRLSSSVVTGVSDDTNVTGSISSNTLTLGWTGTLAKARQHSATVYNDQANTYSSSVLQSFFAGSSNIEFRDATTPSKKFTFDASNISASTTRTVNIPDANSTTAQAKSATSHQFLTAMSSQGVFSAAQPSTDDVTEGANLYYTDARARASVSVSSPLAYNSTTGAFTFSYNSTNLKITSSALNTIQDLATTSTPQFAGLGIGVVASVNYGIKSSYDGVNLSGTTYINNFFSNAAGSKGVYTGYDSSAQLGVIASQGASSGINFVTHNGSAWGARLFIDTTGNVGINTTSVSSGMKLEVNGGMALNTATSKPSCSSTTRGTFWVTQGAAGVKDDVEVCAKSAADSYAWRTIY